VVLWLCAACAPVLIAAGLLTAFGGHPARTVADVLLILVGVTVITGHSFHRARDRWKPARPGTVLHVVRGQGFSKAPAPIRGAPMGSTGTPSHTQHNEPTDEDNPMTELNPEHARRATVEHTRRLAESAVAAGPDAAVPTGPAVDHR
jgi:hypothetical protein